MIFYLVEVIHLNGDTSDDRNSKDPSTSPPQLVVPCERQLEGDSEPFHRHDGDTSDEGTDRDVDEGVRTTVFRGDPVDRVEGVTEDD